MLKDRIAAGETLLGTFLKTPSPILVEVLGGCGVDLVCLDAEHAPFDRGDLDRCIMAARAVGLPVLVRTATASPEHILNALDCGADGVLLPHIRNAREAAATALAASYGPGGRGYAGSSRAARYGLAPMGEHRAATAARTVVIERGQRGPDPHAAPARPVLRRNGASCTALVACVPTGLERELDARCLEMSYCPVTLLEPGTPWRPSR